MASELGKHEGMYPLNRNELLIRRPPARLAPAPRPPRPALAAHARRLSHLGRGNHAAADPGRRGDSLLPALSRALPRYRHARRRAAGRGAAAVERPGLLLARAQPAARGAAGARAPRWPVSARASRHRGAARHRALDRGGDRGVRLRHARRDSGRQRQARARAAFRRRRISGRQARREPPVAIGGGATAVARHRSLHPGNDGSGSDAVHARQASLQRLPAR